MSDKSYKSYDELLNILCSRGMKIEKSEQWERAKRILETENYYNVINGYKDLFIDRPETETNDEHYKDEITFDEVYALYSFDRELRGIYLKFLLKIENAFKTVISHEFSDKHGHDNYLKLDNFRTETEKDIASVTKLFGDIQQETARQMNKHHQVVTHYMTKHGYIPFWVLVNVLTFGKITIFYSYMKEEDKKEVAVKFSIPSEELHKYMEMLGLARNKCAHNERFFDIKFRKSLHTKSIKNFCKLSVTKNNDGSYTHGTNDAYAIAIIFALLLSEEDLKQFVSLMQKLFTDLDKQLHIISINDVMLKMGFESGWENLAALKY